MRSSEGGTATSVFTDGLRRLELSYVAATLDLVIIKIQEEEGCILDNTSTLRRLMIVIGVIPSGGGPNET